jgi:hypothetical protein
MSDDRIPTDLWVAAHLKRCSADAIPAVVARRGDATGGLVMLKLAVPGPARGWTVRTQTRDQEGRPAWLAARGGATLAEGEADAYIARAVARDPDLWVVEIDDRDGRNPFEGPVLA